MNGNFRKTQRFRVICNGVCFYTTRGQILENVGDFTAFNEALRRILYHLENQRRCYAPDSRPVGLSATLGSYAIQLTMV